MIRAGKELALTGKISRQTAKKANEPMIKLPPFVRLMLKLGIGREKVIAARNKI